MDVLELCPNCENKGVVIKELADNTIVRFDNLDVLFESNFYRCPNCGEEWQTMEMLTEDLLNMMLAVPEELLKDKDIDYINKLKKELERYKND